MDFILQSLQVILGLVMGTAGTWGLTELCKRLNGIPVTEGQTTALRVVAGVGAFVSVAATSMSGHSFDPSTLQGFLGDGLMFAITWYGAHLAHKQLKAQAIDVKPTDQ